MSSTRITDANCLARDALVTGYQVSSLLAPPLYIATVIARRGRHFFSVKGLLRTTWLAGLGGVRRISLLSFCAYLVLSHLQAVQCMAGLHMVGIRLVTKIN